MFKPLFFPAFLRSLQKAFSFSSLLPRFVALASGLLLLTYSPVAFAAESPSLKADPPSLDQPAPSRSSLGAEDISSEKVNQFVHAYLQVVDLIEQREGEVQGAETDSESFQAEQEIEAEAFSIIEAAGLTWQEYLQLLGLANTDPEFGERIAIQLQEATN